MTHALSTGTMACTRCGARRKSGPGSLPPEQYVCLACRRAARVGDAPPLKLCSVDGCQKRARAKTLCGAHYEARRVGVGMPPKRLCADCTWWFQPRDVKQRFCSPRCANHHRDSQRQRGHRKHFDDVWARDAGVCGICSEPIDATLTFPHRYSATLDHIVPRSHGGSDEPDNLRLAHLTCNAARQNRIE